MFAGFPEAELWNAWQKLAIFITALGWNWDPNEKTSFFLPG